jgi:hypothetical protein
MPSNQTTVFIDDRYRKNPAVAPLLYRKLAQQLED